MQFDNLNLTRVILELRYDDGFLYLDNCGATNLEIIRNFPKWKQGKTSTELSTFREAAKKIELVFNIHHIRFIQDEVDNLNQLKKAATEIAPIILKNLQINTFSRVGNRFYYVFPLENIEQGKDILQKSKLIEIPEKKLTLFGKNPKKTRFLVYFQEGNRQYRIELTPIERIEKGGIGKINEKFFPKFGLRAYIDFAIINKVNALDFSCSEFIQHNFKFLESNLIKLIHK